MAKTATTASTAILKSNAQLQLRSDTTITIDPLDKIQYPYIDDDGWIQLYTLFDTHSEVETIDVPVRIIAYVDARHNLDLAAWSFGLIDNPSKTALFKSSGQRQSTLQRALLQGCITLLSSLRNSNHAIEFRTSRLDLIHLLELLIENPYADCPEEWEAESAFVSQLSFYLEQQTVLLRPLPIDETDFASQIVEQLSLQRLNALNNGDSSDFMMRKRFFPLERLMN